MSYNYTTDDESHLLSIIVILGDSGVGKTSLLQRFSQDQFSTDYVATIGVDFRIRRIDIDGKRCTLQMWDTSGQDRFKYVVSSYYRGADGVVICFDTTDLESFRNVDKWFEEVKKYCAEETPVFLVGTKSDLQSKRMVSYATIKAYVAGKNLTYVETSSKTSANIENCFLNFTKALIEHSNQKELRYKQIQSKPFPDPRHNAKLIASPGCVGGKSCTI